MKTPRPLLIVVCILALGYIGCDNSSSKPKHSNGQSREKTVPRNPQEHNVSVKQK